MLREFIDESCDRNDAMCAGQSALSRLTYFNTQICQYTSHSLYISIKYKYLLFKNALVMIKASDCTDMEQRPRFDFVRNGQCVRQTGQRAGLEIVYLFVIAMLSEDITVIANKERIYRK